MAERTRREEIKKQLIDQPLHVIMGIASISVISAFFSWRRAPNRVSVILAGIITFAWEAIREFRQWPSSRWYDPPLDWFFELGGIALGLFITIRWTAPALQKLLGRKSNE